MLKKTLLALIIVVVLLGTVAAVWSQKNVSASTSTVITAGGVISSDGKTSELRPLICIPDATCPVSALQMLDMALFDATLPVKMEGNQLTQDQVNQLMEMTQALSESNQAMKDLESRARAESKRLREMLLADQVDPRQLRAQATRAEQAEAAIVDAQIDKWLQARSTMTPEQLAKIRELAEKGPIIHIPEIKSEE